MQFSVLLLALAGLLGCTTPVSSIKCYMCNYADTDDPEIIAALQSDVACKTDPPSKYLITIPSQPEQGPVNKPAGSSSAGLAIKGQLANQTVMAAGSSRVDYDIYCFTATGKFQGVNVILRGGAYFQKDKFGDKDGKCDTGKDIGLDIILTNPNVCYCDDDGCNDGKSDRLQCYMCNYADTQDATIIAEFQSTKDCKSNPPRKYLETMPSQPRSNPVNKTAGSLSIALAVTGFQGQLANHTVMAAGSPRVDYDIYCLTATGKYRGVNILMRGGAYFQKGAFGDKDGKCDTGKDLGLDKLLTSPEACYCDDDYGCNDGKYDESKYDNAAGLVQFSSLSLVLSIIACAIFF